MVEGSHGGLKLHNNNYNNKNLKLDSAAISESLEKAVFRRTGHIGLDSDGSDFVFENVPETLKQEIKKERIFPTTPLPPPPVRLANTRTHTINNNNKQLPPLPPSTVKSPLPPLPNSYTTTITTPTQTSPTTTTTLTATLSANKDRERLPAATTATLSYSAPLTSPSRSTSPPTGLTSSGPSGPPQPTANVNLNLNNRDRNATVNAPTACIPSPRGAATTTTTEMSNKPRKKGGKRKAPSPKAKKMLIQYFEAGKGILNASQSLKLFNLYDNDDDGFLDEPDAVLYVRDSLELCPILKDDLLKYKPLAKTDEEYLNLFAKLAYEDINTNKNDPISVEELTAVNALGMNRVLRTVFEKSKAALNPVMAAAREKKVEYLMMDYEFKETMAGMNDREKYQGAFKEESVPTQHKNMFALLE